MKPIFAFFLGVMITVICGWVFSITRFDNIELTSPQGVVPIDTTKAITALENYDQYGSMLALFYLSRPNEKTSIILHDTSSFKKYAVDFLPTFIKENQQFICQLNHDDSCRSNGIDSSKARYDWYIGLYPGISKQNNSSNIKRFKLGVLFIPTIVQHQFVRDSLGNYYDTILKVLDYRKKTDRRLYPNMGKKLKSISGAEYESSIQDLGTLEP